MEHSLMKQAACLTRINKVCVSFQPRIRKGKRPKKQCGFSISAFWKSYFPHEQYNSLISLWDLDWVTTVTARQAAATSLRVVHGCRRIVLIHWFTSVTRRVKMWYELNTNSHQFLFLNHSRHIYSHTTKNLEYSFIIVRLMDRNIFSFWTVFFKHACTYTSCDTKVDLYHQNPFSF